MIGLIPLLIAAWWKATAPYRAPWSVRARLSKPFALASSTRSVIRPSPSSRLNSECVWRWTKSLEAIGIGKAMVAAGGLPEPATLARKQGFHGGHDSVDPEGVLGPARVQAIAGDQRPIRRGPERK